VSSSTDSLQAQSNEGFQYICITNLVNRLNRSPRACLRVKGADQTMNQTVNDGISKEQGKRGISLRFRGVVTWRTSSTVRPCLKARAL